MRYIGNKENLVETIFQVLMQQGIKGDSFFDVFSGTANVGKFFKRQGYQVFSNDLMYYSYVLQKAYIENDSPPLFKELLSSFDIAKKEVSETPLQKVLSYLNDLSPVKGFIYSNYTPEGTPNLDIPRMYYTGKNGQFIDKVRIKIEEWYAKKVINDHEYYVLIASLIETVPFYANISGVYGAFHKKWDSRALKEMKLREVEVISNGRNNQVYNTDSKLLLDEVSADIYYLDPPYNQRQYAPNYHLLETIARYDSPKIKGVTGMRDYSQQKSKFCQRRHALDELENFVEHGNYKHLILSYNSEGLMVQEEILEMMKPYGNTELVEFDYTRYKSNSNGSKQSKKYVKEQLYLLSK
ncbi:DNA adenine methylase [Psychrobacter sp. P11G5]|uniref:DNA adenine methylase n=1 Tax=Psychrobacter sp. P11G5 TaxID=1699624 RepID=UPI00078B2A1D|nr:DNA adenine methylase [Psychrobacter sp. P11G5]AMN69033.1 DNA methyltransferase [Psychrobacter sp. P11G5]